MRAVADLDGERARATAQTFNIPNAYQSYQALLADPDIEVVAVCTPAFTHAEIGTAALRAGKHLFVEKPLALDPSHCEELIEAAANAPAQATVGFNLRWHRLVQQARHLVSRGVLGQITAIQSVLASPFHPYDLASDGGWRATRRLGGGMLGEVAVHSFDLWRFLLAEEVVEIQAMNRSERWEDETVTVLARLTSGALASALFVKGTSDRHGIEIFGSLGHLRLDCYQFDGLHLTPVGAQSGALRTRLHHALATTLSLPRLLRGMRAGGDFVASYRAEWEHFLACVRRDAPPATTLQDGKRATEIMLAAVASIHQQRPVACPPESQRSSTTQP